MEIALELILQVALIALSPFVAAPMGVTEDLMGGLVGGRTLLTGHSQAGL